MALAIGSPSLAQTRAQQAAPPELALVSKLVWSTLAAVDHANQTGNYSVLRDLGAPSFQANNTDAGLAGIFQNIRNQRVDLARTLLIAPTYQFEPAIVQGGYSERAAASCSDLYRLASIFFIRTTAGAGNCWACPSLPFQFRARRQRQPVAKLPVRWNPAFAG